MTPILQACRAYVDDLIQAGGYGVKYFSWSDEDEAVFDPFVMFRFAGGAGLSDELKQEFDVSVVMLSTPDRAVSSLNEFANMQRRFRESGVAGPVRRFEVLGNITGPSYLENGRPVFSMDIRCYTEVY